MSVPTLGRTVCTVWIVWITGLALLTACGRPVPEPVRVDVRGVITSLARGGRAGEAGTLRIEGGKQADTRYDKAVVTVTPATPIYQREPSGRGRVPFESLRLGDKVEVRFIGPVAGSRPVQATAGEILILLHLALAERPAEESGDAYPPQFTGTQGLTEKAPPDRLPLTLRDVRTGPQEHFDRAVFEFDADTVPGYRVEYIGPPKSCGSGLPAEVRGTAWLQVRLHPAQAHNKQGGSTVGTLRKQAGLKVLQEVQEVCDFEGETTWVLGLAGRRGYRVLELAHPPRLVVDVAR
jgi:hypothetical protein